MKKVTGKSFSQRWIKLAIALNLVTVLVGCNQTSRTIGPVALNSRYTDEQPTLSGNGRFVAFVSNRDNRRKIWLYDLQQQQFVDLPGLNKPAAIAETPSISRNARYIVYIASDRGRPELFLYDRATRSSQILTQSYLGWVRNPSISPDGRYVAFESSSRGRWDIEVIDRGPNIELDRPEGGG